VTGERRAIPLDFELATERLTLRRFLVTDAERVNEITSNWNVARMLRLAPYPQSVEETRAWLASHEAEWLAGDGYRFAVVEGGRLIGCADLDEILRGRNEIGYWFDEAVWGRGYAGEAAAAVRDFGLATLGLDHLESGHAFDNPASGRVLLKLGFRKVGETIVWSLPRKAEIVQIKYRLDPGR
jgi:RimJ/RimL family protein N-acetyltransferase